MNRYTVTYDTRPTPAGAYYRGTIEVWADEEDDVEAVALAELTRVAPDYTGFIRIQDVAESD